MSPPTACRPLEPTDEQVAAILATGAFSSYAFADHAQEAREMFALVRDMVLEAAARVADDSLSEVEAAAAIRALKSKP